MDPQTPNSSNKIKDLGALAGVVADLKSRGKRVVHCHGVFDLLHLGHIRHFRNAREFGDVLVVTLTPDQWVNKGPNRPIFNHNYRAEVIASLGVVDYVAINQWPNAVETLKLLKPSFYVKGSDYADAAEDVTGGIKQEQDAVEAGGGKLVFTDDITFSSSSLINRHMSNLSPEMVEFLDGFAKRNSCSDVIGYLEAAKSLNVLVIGEAILDEYHYCETLGKSGKEPILAVRFLSSEKWPGGNLAVANHVASFVDHVNLMSYLGDEDSHESFIREKLKPSVEPNFLYMAKAPTILKRRFVESYPFQKMFEVYLMKDDQSEAANAERLCRMLLETLPKFDLVIATDYGHGMLSPQVIDILSSRAKFLAVNTQANAANHGFNTVSKYPRADYVSVSEKELRLETRQHRADLREIVEGVVRKLGCQRMTVTRGRQGLLCYSREQGYVEVPALAGHFTDRVGAGDAVFAITSLCAAQKAPADIIGLVGNAVGAIAVNTIGNRDSIDRAALIRSIVTLLK